MTVVDYAVVDMPTTLARAVLRQDKADPSKWVRDDEWYENIRVTYGSLLKFFADHQLLMKPITQSLDMAVVRLSDLNDLGVALIRSGADDKWLASFDRAGSTKALDDVSYLEKALNRIQRGAKIKR
jgi:hypothetical protein